MQSPTIFYTDKLSKHKDTSSHLYKRLTALSFIRLFVFTATGVGVYLTFNNIQIAIPIGLIGVVVFLYLLSKYTDTKYQYRLEKALVEINDDELKIASGDFHSRKPGESFQDPSHQYSLDIDLFGIGSFFQNINRTTTHEGTETLVKTLKANNIIDINKRQDAIKELSEKPEWRQQFLAVSSLIKVETTAFQILNWLKNHVPFLRKIMRWLPLVFSITSVGFIVLAIFGHMILPVLIYWIFVGLGITGVYVKRINKLALNTEKVKDTFRQYAALLNLIENETFTSELLLEKQNQIMQDQKKASEIFSKFSKHLDALDNRNNMISAIFGNGYFLSDLKNTYNIEQWISEYKSTVEYWFDVVSFFDTYISLGNYAFNHPEFNYPKIVLGNAIIKAKDLGHPLLDKEKRITSDLEIINQQFFIVTGANMAGKSTFLRTVSLHIVMANIGLPVCASSSEYHPVKLITSMRTSDSLTDDSSYFFSELTRLKYIVDAIEEEPYFIILDEILKGTNSTDKAIGSRKFVEKLVSKSATGIIATHDLSLCKIEKSLKEVDNYFFDAQIIDDELYFDYKLKLGICQNMNASFLLKKMEIV